MKRIRLDPEERFEQIICAALHLAEQGHFYYVKMCDVARRAQCSEPLVRYYLGPAPIMRLRVLREAIRRKNTTVIEQGKRWDLITPKGNLRKRYDEQI